MCGRIALYSPPARFARFLDAVLAAGLDPEGPPRWNVAPQQPLFAVKQREGVRQLDSCRWGLVPSWAKDPTTAARLFNARGETIAEKPSFRSAFAKRPCVIPVDGFYEWEHRPGRARQAYYFHRRDDAPLLLAGLYEHWSERDVDNAPVLTTCTVVTTSPNEDLAEIHDRMPVVLEPKAVATWLNVTDHGPDERLALLTPARPGTLSHFAVSAAVGSVKNDGPQLIAPDEPTSLF